MKDQELIIDQNWCVVEEAFDTSTNRHYESILGLGTGYLSVRSNLDEGVLAEKDIRSRSTKLRMVLV